MIKLNDRFFIDFDSMNIMLKEKKIVQTGKNKGKEKLDTVGYYMTFDELANSMLKKCYLKEDDENIKSLKDIQNLMIELKNDITNQIKFLVDEKGNKNVQKEE